MTVQPHKPDSDPGSEQADNLFENLPETLPEKAKTLYFNAYQSSLGQHGNRPEIAHQAGMAAVLEQYEQDESTGKWKKKPA